MGLESKNSKGSNDFLSNSDIAYFVYIISSSNSEI